MHSELGLLAIAGPPLVAVSKMVDTCRAAAEGGVTAIQVRVKDAPAATLLDVADALVRHLSIPVWVNDRADVALAASARGVHVGAEDIPPRAVRAFAGDALAIGVSVGNLAEAEAACREPVDYWSIGSVFATTTKRDAGAPIGTAGFRRLAALAPAGMPTVAIGGITQTNAAEILEVGAHGIAVSQAVFGAIDVRAAARRLRAVIDSFRSA